MYNKNYTVLVIVVVVAMVVAVLGFSFVRRVPPGNVGVLIDWGEGTVSDEPVITPVMPGRFIIIKPLQSLAMYPMSLQSLIMVRSEDEGQVTGDDSVDCKDMAGIQVNVDITVLWKVIPDDIGQLYLNYPNRDIRQISDELVRRISRQAVADACGQYGFIDIAGVKRIEFSLKVAELLQPALASNFINMSDISVGEVYLLPEQQQAITNKSIAEQQALQAQFLLQQRQAEAEAAIAQAEGQKQVKILQAQGQAEAIRVVMEQLGGRTDYYIRYISIDKWNGVVPYVLVTSDGQEFPLITSLPDGIIPVPTSDYPTVTPTSPVPPTATP
ncbi:MAG: Band 7 protein [Microgenomates group bacterium GW2011_GWB1_40_9]|nr:MAG: Band 7 protein [Microgenomates group bacterium GW2011_GWC1_39_12]KKR78970.1 MAG: Band 7 protein [Microgenomates group bacterium GW2011_GWB1_40_9]